MPAAGHTRYLEAAPPQGVAIHGTLLLIHAFPLNARMWEPQLALAARGWRILAPQLRGMDGGAADPPGASMDDYAGDVIDLLDHLHITEAVIGGVSMGGYVSFAVFRHAPRYVRGLVLADTRPQADSPQSLEGRRRILGILDEKGAAGVAAEMLPNLLGETTHRERPELVEHVRSLIVANPPQAIHGAIAAMMTRPDSTPLLSSIHCPTLVLVGEKDRLTSPDVNTEMQRAIAGSELTVIPRVGHLSSLEAPDAFNAALSYFLDHRV